MSASDGRLPRFQASSSEASNSATTAASRANALEVYEDAVQEPLLECTNLASMYYGAQQIGSRRPDARVLREDFCSSAIVAQTWLGMEKENRSQGVDIDLDALCVAQRRIGRTEKRARLIQSAQYSSTGAMRVLESEAEVGLVDDGEAGSGEKGPESEPTTPGSSTSTWSKGATSDRFERRFQARLAKEQLTQARAARADEASGPAPGGEAMTLLHADVLSLPMAEAGVEAPDLVYAGNYALSYFHDRKSLLAYLRQCRRTLRPQTGVLIVDPFAGPTNWEARTNEERNEQHSLWTRFANEPGFLRSNEGDPPAPLKSDDLEVWKPTQAPAARSDWRSWPRGRLVLVREGHVCGGYEYWREDGPIDYVTNRFRMSLSFRFRDGSWLRDYFSYDFRVWSLCEITEAMEEVGFERIQVHAIPRQSSASNDRRSSHDDGSGQGNSKSGSDSGSDVDNGLGGMATLLQRTEREETDKLRYVHVEQGEKLFATKSFGTYIIACMPSTGEAEEKAGKA